MEKAKLSFDVRFGQIKEKEQKPLPDPRYMPEWLSKAVNHEEIPVSLLKDKEGIPNVSPHFYPSELHKQTVWRMAAAGATAEIIRLAIVDPATDKPIHQSAFSYHFAEIVQHAREQANARIALKIFEIALGQEAEYDNDGNIIRPYLPPNLDALKWWDRTRGEAARLFGLRNVISHAADGSGPVTLVIEGS
jgi:hypothetical protein